MNQSVIAITLLTSIFALTLTILYLAQVEVERIAPKDYAEGDEEASDTIK